jgi:serine/threonine-protein kinase
MVLKNGSVKVTDFGIARVMAEGNTLTKEALGSVHYISPEQAKGSRVDNRSDIYSLGVVMYEMMSGKPPYDGESPVAVAVQHINGGAVMPSTINPNIPGGLEQIIMRAMAHEPENRYASATQMLADLDEFRKDPAILFDYNIPPTDEVTNMPKPAAIEEETPVVPLVAEEEESKESNGDMPVMIPRNRAEQEEKTAVATAEPASAPEVVVIPKPAQPKKRPPQQQPRQPQKRPPQQAAPRRTARDRYEEEEARRNKVTTIAIISCVLVMVVAIAILLFMMFVKNGDTQVVVPDFVGKIYEQLDEKDYDFHIFHEEVFSDEVDAGKIVRQEPPAGTLINKNGTVQVFISKVIK